MTMTAFPPPYNGGVLEHSGSLSMSGSATFVDGGANGEVNPARIGRSRSSIRLIEPEVAVPDGGAGGQANNIAQPKQRVRRHTSQTYQAQRAQNMALAAQPQRNPSMRMMPGVPPQQMQMHQLQHPQQQYGMGAVASMAPPAAMAAAVPPGVGMPQQMLAQPPPPPQGMPREHAQQSAAAEPAQRTDSPKKSAFLSGPPPGSAPRRSASQYRLSEAPANPPTTLPRPCPPPRSRGRRSSTEEARPQSSRRGWSNQSPTRATTSKSPDGKPLSRITSPNAEAEPASKTRAKRTASFFRPSTPPRRRRSAAKVVEEEDEAGGGAMQKLSSFFFGKPRNAPRDASAARSRPTSRSGHRSSDSLVKPLTGIEEVPHKEESTSEMEVEELEEVLYRRDLKRMDSVFRTKSFRGNLSDNDDDEDDEDVSEGRRSAPAEAIDSPLSSSPGSNSASPAYAGSAYEDGTPTPQQHWQGTPDGKVSRRRSVSADSGNGRRRSDSSSSDSDNDTGFSGSAANLSQYSMLQEPEYGGLEDQEFPSESPVAQYADSGHHFDASPSLAAPAAVPSRRSSREQEQMVPRRFSPPSQKGCASSVPNVTATLPIQQQPPMPQQRLFSVPQPNQQGSPMMPNHHRHGTAPYAVPPPIMGMQPPYPQHVPYPQPPYQPQQHAPPAQQRSGPSSPASLFNQQAEQARQRACMPGMNPMYMRPMPVGMVNYMPGPMQGPYPIPQGNYPNQGRQQ